MLIDFTIMPFAIKISEMVRDKIDQHVLKTGE
jgi:hypothetical protein